MGGAGGGDTMGVFGGGGGVPTRDTEPYKGYIKGYIRGTLSRAHTKGVSNESPRIRSLRVGG